MGSSNLPDSVGVLGLGIIGSRCAQNLRDSGLHVYVWSRSPKPEPNFLSSPEEMVRLTKTVQIFVTDGEGLLEVIDAMAPALTAEHTVINHATVALEHTGEAAQRVAATGAAFLDCPFTGSKEAAANGALNYYVGGDAEVLERVRPLLEITANEIIPVGAIGEATVLKIATNMISASTVQALAESMAVVASHGIALEKLQLALDHNAGASPLVKMKIPTMIHGDYEPHFSLNNMFKDAQFGLGLANAAGVDLPVLTSTASAMFNVIKRGHGDDDYSVLYRRYSDRIDG